MAIQYKISTRIWWDKEFRSLQTNEMSGGLLGRFGEYRGPRYRVADKPHRRPDLYTSAWRRVREAVLRESDMRCVYCGKDCSDDHTVDHVVHICHGGARYDRSNLAVSCRACNSRKVGRESWT